MDKDRFVKNIGKKKKNQDSTTYWQKGFGNLLKFPKLQLLFPLLFLLPIKEMGQII